MFLIDKIFMKKIKFFILLIILLLVPFLYFHNVYAKPNAPSSISGSNTLPVNISWTSVPEAEHYILFRTTDSPAMVPNPSWIPIVGNVSGTSYADNSVISSTSYWYSIIAVDTDDPFDQFSDRTISLRVDTPAAPPPAPVGTSGLFPFVQCGDEGEPPCTLCHLFETANRIFIFIRNISFIIGGLMLVVGGIMMLISGSSIRQLDLAKKIIKNVIIGLVLIMLSFIIVTSILATFAPGAATMFNLKGGSFEIECDI
jgi:hypothetical protein